jgi:hypothetical protein
MNSDRKLQGKVVTRISMDWCLVWQVMQYHAACFQQGRPIDVAARWKGGNHTGPGWYCMCFKLIWVPTTALEYFRHLWAGSVLFDIAWMFLIAKSNIWVSESVLKKWKARARSIVQIERFFDVFVQWTVRFLIVCYQQWAGSYGDLDDLV